MSGSPGPCLLPSRTDLAGLDTVTLARLLRSGNVTAVEVMQAFQTRIAQANTELNALVTVLDSAAAQEAPAEGAHRLASADPGPLEGIPIVVKDNIATAGMRTTWGSRLLADHVPATDATAVSRLRAAGAIVIGKGNTPEFAADIQTSNDLFGPTRNPLDLTLSPGGSSGGVSAAVAAGFASLGIGTDYGGSIRWPAQCVNLVGLRPTCGLIPGTGQFPVQSLYGGRPNSLGFQSRLQTIGPIARSIEDLELALNVMAGPDAMDPHAVPVPIRSSHDVDLTQLEIGWLTGEGNHRVRADVADALQPLVGALTTAGLKVQPQDSALLAAAEETFTRVRALEGMTDLRPMTRGREAELTSDLQKIVNATPGALTDYLEAAAHADYLRARFLQLLERCQLLLMPVSLIPALKVGERQPRVEDNEVEYWKVVAPCRAISLFGVPVASVPIGTSRDGSPVSVQIIGRPFHDHEVLALARMVRRLEPSVAGAEAGVSSSSGSWTGSTTCPS